MSRKKYLAAVILYSSVLVARSVQATPEQEQSTVDIKGWSVDAGVSYFNMDPDLPQDLTIHSTHPDDRSFMSGSAGSTKLDEVDMTFLNLEVKYNFLIPITKKTFWKLEPSYVLKVPVSEEGRARKQNENDTRPAVEGSFIYTELSDVSLQHEIGVKASFNSSISGTKAHYSITPSIYLGYWQMSFEKGWDRFGRDETEYTSDADGFSISPQIAFALENKQLNFSVFAGYRAISLDYDSSSSDSSTATGIEFGASVGWKF